MTEDSNTSQEFSALYLQRLTTELAEDIDKVRTADDFKADSIPFLVHALQQGSQQFTTADQKRVIQSKDTQDADSKSE